MKFIVDAQLPIRLKNWLVAQGYDSIHTDEIAMETQKEPTDSEIAELALQDNRTVISKDSDFFKTHILTGKPPKLLFITTGNIINKELLLLFERNFETALLLFNSYDIVEMNNFFVVGHGK